jgi:hypothetical protein
MHACRGRAAAGAGLVVSMVPGAAMLLLEYSPTIHGAAMLVPCPAAPLLLRSSMPRVGRRRLRGGGGGCVMDAYPPALLTARTARRQPGSPARLVSPAHQPGYGARDHRARARPTTGSLELKARLFGPLRAGGGQFFSLPGRRVCNAGLARCSKGRGTRGDLTFRSRSRSGQSSHFPPPALPRAGEGPACIVPPWAGCTALPDVLLARSIPGTQPPSLPPWLVTGGGQTPVFRHASV